MEFIPHLLLEGMIVSSFALGANTAYIYIRGEYAWRFRNFYFLKIRSYSISNLQYQRLNPVRFIFKNDTFYQQVQHISAKLHFFSLLKLE